MRYRTKPWDSPEMNGYPSYCVWDTELNEIADDNGLLLIFSSVTGEIACKDANEMTAELNSKENEEKLTQKDVEGLGPGEIRKIDQRVIERIYNEETGPWFNDLAKKNRERMEKEEA